MIDLENKMDALLDEIREMIREKRYADLRDMFLPMESADIAQILEEAGPEVMPLLYRLLFNLTENAIRYGRPDGAVRIAVSEADGNVQIRVRDHGPGIPEAELARIHAPIGLDILGQTPAEIAVSIAAEMILHRAKRSGTAKKPREEG